MKSRLPSPVLLIALGAATLAAQPAAPVSFQDALTQGEISLNARLRYEHVDQDGFKDADALTALLRLGYTTQSYHGFQAMIEGEAVTPLVRDYYDGTGTNGSNYATVTDPEVYQLNQAWLSYAYEKTKATLGRQRLILDNARFIGDSGWRQNDQTFDAFVLQDKTLDGLTLTYAYLDRINRVFDDSGAQPDWKSDSHLLNASYAGLPFGTLTAYTYLLDFDADSAPATKTAVRNNSNATYGLSLAGALPLTKSLKALYRLEYARQTDYGDSTLHYAADYYTAELGAAYDIFSLAAGYEVLGSDNGVGFKTPLATLHAFNGWADVFSSTPADGLTDLYLKAGARIPGPVNLLAVYHVYGGDTGAEQLGRELDAQATYKFSKRLSFTVKAAKFWSDQPGVAFADRTKFWLQTDYTY